MYKYDKQQYAYNVLMGYITNIYNEYLYSPQYPPSQIGYYVNQINNPFVMLHKHIIKYKYNIKTSYLHYLHKMEQVTSHTQHFVKITYKTVCTTQLYTHRCMLQPQNQTKPNPDNSIGQSTSRGFQPYKKHVKRINIGNKRVD